MSEDLHALSTDELRTRAFARAERTRDVAFVWDVVRHMRGARAIAGEDGSSGAITGSVAEAVHVVRELLGKEPLGEDEPLLRARFLDYLRD
ncbi:MAG: hypothetical protein AVDCRST_MAG07-3297 [uncultured Frankineae bacterium]|uniref:Uncharacterized protein n=1 Tax=uncultured Frankineae bacterium TaxID=437475 RepID=A0A6J4MDG3_9ACTN|nr:MAG: hypothetical protein AVDCRST_MAG07-3297 [uncultured Frankineae bacterium]